MKISTMALLTLMFLCGFGFETVGIGPGDEPVDSGFAARDLCPNPHFQSLVTLPQKPERVSDAMDPIEDPDAELPETGARGCEYSLESPEAIVGHLKRRCRELQNAHDPDFPGRAYFHLSFANEPDLTCVYDFVCCREDGF